MFRTEYRPEHRHYYQPDNGTGSGTGTGIDNGDTGSDIDGLGDRDGDRTASGESGTAGNGNEGTDSGGELRHAGSAVGVVDGVRSEVQSDTTGTGTGTGRRRRTGSDGGNTGIAEPRAPRANAGTAGRTEATRRVLEHAELVIEQGAPQAVKKAAEVQSLRKKRTSAKPGDIDDSEVGMFLEGMFGIAAAIAGRHWVISSDESESIAKPLTSILNKMNKKKKDNLGSLMAPLLLITAVSAVVVPRARYSYQEFKAKEAYENARRRIQNQTPVTRGQANTPRDESPAIGGHNESPDGSQNGVTDGQAFFAAIDSVIPSAD